MIVISRHSKKCVYDNINFDSESERDFYIKLKSFKKQKKIKDFSLNPTYVLQEGFETEYIDFPNSKEKPITYIVDYSVTLNSGQTILVDTKGASGQTVEEVAKLKRKILLSQHKDTPIFFISKCPKYLAENETWICVNGGTDFYSKLKNKYYNLYPEQKKKRGKKDIQWTVNEWKRYFEFEEVGGLFYIWKKTNKISK